MNIEMGRYCNVYDRMDQVLDLAFCSFVLLVTCTQ